ncbi:MAG: hypothetical protein GF311_18855 [Candidatus Lokiarchaeota archaeon]|nr:hypothetical protein [Candidatus Lokiarchaeota archaeon]
MAVLKRIIMISPVGLEKDRVLAGFKKFGATNVYLIQSEKKDGSEERLANIVRNFASDLGNYLEKIMDNIVIEEANITDLKSCLEVLKKIIKQEMEKKAKLIYINISTSSKIFAISAIYIAGLYPDIVIPFYVQTSNYLIQDIMEVLNNEELKNNTIKCLDELNRIKENFEKNGWTQGEYKITLIPALPFKRLTKFQKNIFSELIKEPIRLKLQDLINTLKSDKIKERSFRSKLSYALRDLTNYGLVKKSREGREVALNLTEIGEIFGKFLI